MIYNYLNKKKNFYKFTVQLQNEGNCEAAFAVSITALKNWFLSSTLFKN